MCCNVTETISITREVDRFTVDKSSHPIYHRSVLTETICISMLLSTQPRASQMILRNSGLFIRNKAIRYYFSSVVISYPLSCSSLHYSVLRKRRTSISTRVAPRNCTLSSMEITSYYRYEKLIACVVRSTHVCLLPHFHFIL